MQSAADAAVNAFGRAPVIPPIPFRAPPGLAPPPLPLSNIPEMFHGMPLHGLISPTLSVGYEASDLDGLIFDGHRHHRERTQSSMSPRSRLATASSDTYSSTSSGSNMSSMCSLSKVSSASSIASGRSTCSTVG